MTDGASGPVGRPDHDWDEMYGGGPLPWDIGRPQPVFAALASNGQIQGRVLDAGCGTGEHALMVAARGSDVTGLDVSTRAITIARRKAEERGLSARFVAGDARRLGELEERFDTVLDCGLFHCFDDDDRVHYTASLADAVEAGGKVLLCCFSNEEPGDWGPRRVRQEELRAAFADGWTIESIEPAELETNIEPTVRAWLMTATRT